MPVPETRRSHVRGAADRVRAVEVRTAVVPLPKVLRLGPMVVTEREYAGVRVVTDDGVVGKAYCLTRGAPMGAIVDRLISPFVLGQSADDPEGAWEAAFWGSVMVGRTGLVMHALGLVDVALWDIAAQRLGVPLWSLLGEGVVDAEPVDGMLVAAYPSQGRDPNELAAEVVTYARQGWPLVKVARSPDVSLMRQMLHALGEDLPTGCGVVVDAGFGWTDAGAAVAELRAWGDVRLAWLEDPLIPEDVTGYELLRREAGQPIGAGDGVADSRTIDILLAHDALDVARIDVIGVGGVTAARQVMRRAARYEVPVSFHVYPEVSVHLAMIGPPGQVNVETFDRTGNAYDPAATLVNGGPRFACGHVAPSDAIGLGFDLDWARFAADDS